MDSKKLLICILGIVLLSGSLIPTFSSKADSINIYSNTSKIYVKELGSCTVPLSIRGYEGRLETRLVDLPFTLWPEEVSLISGIDPVDDLRWFNITIYDKGSDLGVYSGHIEFTVYPRYGEKVLINLPMDIELLEGIYTDNGPSLFEIVLRLVCSLGLISCLVLLIKFLSTNKGGFN